jgi:hypothetical protein
MTDTERIPNLLDCPFCGGKVESYLSTSNVNPPRGVFSVECWNEGCPLNTKYDRKTDAITAWNSRSILSETPRMPEKIVPVFEEIERAVKKYPTWPTDPLHALSVLGEEFGELTKSTLQLTYEPHKTSMEDFRTEAKQTAAVALRFFMSLEQYQFNSCKQHKQSILEAIPQGDEEA